MSTETPQPDNAPELSGQVLIVDDDRTARAIHRGILARQFDAVTASSGTEALAACRVKLPDLVLLDAEMPELDGYETCRKLREWTSVPIIFATAHRSLEEHLKAYDAGGNDLVTKPVSSDILLRKVALAIRDHQATLRLSVEKEHLQHMAMSFLSSMGESGTLLNFMRASVVCRTHRALGEKLIEAAGNFGLHCDVLIRHDDGPTVLSWKGEPTPLERAILEQSSDMGRIFQFQRRLAVNYDRVSLIVANMPDESEEPEHAGRIRDNLVILAEIAEGLCDNVDMRLESMRRAEQMQLALSGAQSAVQLLHEKHLNTLGDTRLLLHDLENEVEKTYGWLGINEEQEEAISQTTNRSVRRILALLAEAGSNNDQFEAVLDALRGSGRDNSVELF